MCASVGKSQPRCRASVNLALPLRLGLCAAVSVCVCALDGVSGMVVGKPRDFLSLTNVCVCEIECVDGFYFGLFVFFRFSSLVPRSKPQIERPDSFCLLPSSGPSHLFLCVCVSVRV